MIGGNAVKKFSLGTYLKNFFFAFGLLVFLGVPLLFMTNAFGIGSMFSVIGVVKQQCLWQPSNSQIMDGIMSGVAAVVNDPYTEYYNKEEWEEINAQLNYEISGIGVQLIKTENNTINIISPIEGSPAQKVGLKNNDILMYIDGKSTKDMTEEQVSSLLKGKAGTKVDVTVFRTDENKEYNFTMKRKIIHIPTVETVELEEYPDFGYIRFYQFTESSVKKMTKALKEFKDKKGLILDLRDNPGGDLYSAIEIADLFLDDGDIISTVDVKGKKTTYWAHPEGTKQPLVLLVNGNSASSSEVLSAALHDNNRAIMVGQKTFGKGIVQSLYELRNGGVIKVTTDKYLTPNSVNIHQIGIEPDYVIPDPEIGMPDKQLEKAISLLEEKRR